MTKKSHLTLCMTQRLYFMLCNVLIKSIYSYFDLSALNQKMAILKAHSVHVHLGHPSYQQSIFKRYALCKHRKQGNFGKSTSPS